VGPLLGVQRLDEVNAGVEEQREPRQDHQCSGEKSASQIPHD